VVVDYLTPRCGGERVNLRRWSRRVRCVGGAQIEETAVYNRSGDLLGSVYNFMVNKRSGQVAYAVLSFGGFLGIGSSYHPLPRNDLTYDPSLGGYVVNPPKSSSRVHPPIRFQSCSRGMMQSTASSIPSFSLRHKRIERPHGNSGKNRGTGVIGRSLRSRGGGFPHLNARRDCIPTPIRELLWSSGSASRTRQFTTF
jgi:hypothetical protein